MVVAAPVVGQLTGAFARDDRTGGLSTAGSNVDPASLDDPDLDEAMRRYRRELHVYCYSGQRPRAYLAVSWAWPSTLPDRA